MGSDFLGEVILWWLQMPFFREPRIVAAIIIY
jgi:hypothetical protein